MSVSSSSSSSGPLATNIEGVASSMEWEDDQEKAGGVSDDYQLSAQLTGHDYAVRDLACSGTDVVATLEEKGRVSVWQRVSRNAWERRSGFEERMHESLAFVIENVEGGKMRSSSSASSTSADAAAASSSSATAVNAYPKATFMSGGGDKAARPFTANGSTFPPLSGHNGPVNSISLTHPDRHVLTGSWDGIVRLWAGDQLLRTFDKLGHEHGTEVLGLENGNIVTASTNKAIVIIDLQGNIQRKIPNAHEAPIRKLIAHPLGFVSAGNDGLVKLWNASGEMLQQISAHTSSEVKFIYGLAFIPGVNDNLDTSRIVSCGEDGMVRVFDPSGDCVQSIPHPGPVRSVVRLGSGDASENQPADFATACADKTVRIFTRHRSHFASGKLRKEFREIGELIKAAGGMKQIDTSSLEGEEALTVPGTKNGQVKVLNIKGRNVPIAYQWSDDLQQWIEIGEAMGAGGSTGSSSKKMLDGQAYDFVTDVYLTDTHKVQLGFNADDDPAEVTDRFCTIYQVPADMRSQIYEFVAPKCDPVAGAAKKARLAEESAQRVELQQVPSWTSGGFEIYSQANIQAMEKKIRETNQMLIEQQNSAAIQGDGLKHLNALFDSLRDPTQYHVAPFSSGEVSIVRQLLQWPTEHILPILDCVRLLMVHAGANEALGGDPQLMQQMFNHVKTGNKPGKDTHKILLIKAICNWLAKRQRTDGERAAPATIPQPVFNGVMMALTELRDTTSTENENLAVAFVMLMHNIICWFGRLRIDTSELYGHVVESCIKLLQRKRNSKIQFYALLTIGSIAYASNSSKAGIRTTFGQQLTSLIQQASQSDNAALQQVALDCKKLYNI